MNALPDWFWISLLALGAVVLVGASLYATPLDEKPFAQSLRTGSHHAKEDETHFKATEQEIQSLLQGNGGKWINICSDPIGVGCCSIFAMFLVFHSSLHVATRRRSPPSPWVYQVCRISS